MADKGISDLTAAGSVSSSDLFEIENVGGNSRKATGAQVGQMAAAYGGLVKIETATPTGTNTYTFSSIAGTYTDLVLSVSGRTASASQGDDILMRVNGLSTSIYDRQRTYSNGGTNTAEGSNGQTSMQISGLAGNSADAGVSGGGEIVIFNYADTNLHKVVIGKYRSPQATAGSGYMVTASGAIRTTGAITSVTLTTSGNFQTGTRLTLYGRA